MINGRLFSFLVIYILKFGGERNSGYQVYIGSVPPGEMFCDFGAAGMAGGDLGAGEGFCRTSQTGHFDEPWQKLFQESLQQF